MQTHVVVVFVAVFRMLSFDVKASTLKGSEDVKSSAVVKAPSDGQTDDKTKLEHVKKILADIAKARDALRRLSTSSSEDQKPSIAYRAAWSLCLSEVKESKDSIEQRFVLEAWNKCLKEDDDAVPLQVYALAEQWNRSFVTETMWQTLKQTKNSKTVRAIVYVLYQNGSAEDLEHMIRIEKEMPGRGLPNAISWLRYRLSNDKTGHGPAAAPPRMD